MTEPEERLLYLLQSAVASLIIKVTSQTGDADVVFGPEAGWRKPRNEVRNMDGATSMEGGNYKM